MRYLLQLLISLSIVNFISPSTVEAQVIRQDQAQSLKQIPLRIGNASLIAEVADTYHSRQIGLMHRHFMPDNHGMLFVFANPQPLCFWMRNTHIPLSIAYLDEHAKVIDIFDMQPLDENSICSTKPAQFALEVNQGWFKRHQIKQGDAIQRIEWSDIPKAQ
ncbi:MAG: DUF192 domain-containing protein [Alcaligenaceae bacterium]|jgi:uncharacterized membrane protein (UPF0127 family)|nr:DUF192 domain-containing protein [Alcaligenaceae bacterium]